jgi:hypothetical protein
MLATLDIGRLSQRNDGRDALRGALAVDALVVVALVEWAGPGLDPEESSLSSNGAAIVDSCALAVSTDRASGRSVAVSTARCSR